MPPVYGKLSSRGNIVARLSMFLALALSAVGVSGCGGTSPVSQLRTGAPAEAAAKVMELRDVDKDGKLTAAELSSSPGLLEGLTKVDANQDGAIDLAEMTSRFTAHDELSDVVAVQVQVAAKGVPLNGAQVTFTPEPFMGESKQAYAGTSVGGTVPLAGEATPLPGLPTGYYVVRIVHPKSGVDVTRGCEVAEDALSGNRIVIDAQLPAKAAPGRR